jgi:hypothetical protein
LTTPDPEETAAVADNDRERDAARIWDRLGSAMGAAGELGEAIAQRNLDLWNRVASNLSKSRYTADDLTADAAQAMTTVMHNLRDIWTVATAPPIGQSTAPGLPSRTLFLQPDPSAPPSGNCTWWGYMVSEDVEAIPVPPPVIEANSIVSIRLAGPYLDSLVFPPLGTTNRLQAFLKAEYSSTTRSVTLVPQDVPRLTEKARLLEGVYQGVVYVDADTTPRAIAHLWIVVQPPPT